LILKSIPSNKNNFILFFQTLIFICIFLTSLNLARTEQDKIKGEANMQNDETIFMDNDLTRYIDIGVKDSNIILTQIIKSRITPVTDSNVEKMFPDEKVDLELTVLEVFQGDKLKPSDKIEIHHQRRGFNKNFGSDGWDSLPLKEGGFLILNAKPAKTPTLWVAIAGKPVNSQNSLEVEELKKCYEIENLKGEQKKKEQLLERGLMEGKSILRSYALNALSYRKLIPRTIAVDIIGRVISKIKDSDVKDTFARPLYSLGLFMQGNDVPDSVDTKILTILAREFIKESEGKNWFNWVQNLTVTLQEFNEDEKKDNAIRKKFILSLDRSLLKNVQTTLRKLSKKGTDDEKETTLELVKVWTEATK